MLKEFMDNNVKYNKVDNKLKRMIREYRINWELDDNNSEFVHNALTGNIKINFKREYSILFFELFTNHSEREFKEAFHALDCIEKNHVVKSMPIYNVLFYFIHLGMIDGDEEFINDCFLIYSYRIITSLISRRFKLYKSDDGVSKLSFEELSKKSKLKTLGSWKAVFLYRSAEIQDGVWAERIINYDCEEVGYIIADQQNKIRKMTNKLTEGINKVYKDKTSIRNISMDTTTEDGSVHVRDITTSMIEDVISDYNINPKIVNVVASVANVKYKALLATINKVDNDSSRDELIRNILQHIDTYLKSKFGTEKKPLDVTLITILNYYKNSRLDDIGRGNKNRIMKIMGTKTNVSQAFVVYVYLKAYLNK
jgi:hypothetical protein